MRLPVLILITAIIISFGFMPYASSQSSGPKKAGGSEFSAGGFRITRVMNDPKRLNALGKMAMFTDTDAVGRYTELSKTLPQNEQGEEFIVTWSYSGTGNPDALVRIEYVTAKSEKISVFEKTYDFIKSASYEVVLRNLDSSFRERGEIAHWRVTIFSGGKPVASKHSVLWHAFEGLAKGAGK